MVNASIRAKSWFQRIEKLREPPGNFSDPHSIELKISETVILTTSHDTKWGQSVRMSKSGIATNNTINRKL